MQHTYIFEKRTQVDDGIGGTTEKWVTERTVTGYLDMLTGSDTTTLQNAVIVESTHVLIIPDFQEGLHERLRVIDEHGKIYDVEFCDDPVEQHHHNEVYLKHTGGVVDE